MKIASISDTHIEKTGDDRETFLDSFLTDERVMSCDIIILNGDIFDYATGYHPEYQVRFSRFFQNIASLMSNKTKIVFIEGNHDLHIKKNFDHLIKDQNLDSKYFDYSRNEYLVTDEESGKKLLFTHGDEIPGSSTDYIRYKEIIRSYPLRIIANILPLWLFDYLAIRASSNSRRKSSKYSEEESLTFFRDNAMKLAPKADIIVLGHSHISDEYRVDGKAYFNNGFAPSSKNFFYYSHEAGPSLESI